MKLSLTRVEIDRNGKPTKQDCMVLVNGNMTREAINGLVKGALSGEYISNAEKRTAVAKALQSGSYKFEGFADCYYMLVINTDK